MISGFRLPSHWKSNASAKKVTGSNTKKDSETSDCRPWWRTLSFALCRRRLPTYKSTAKPGRCESNCGAERTKFTWRSKTTGAGSIWRRRPPAANLVRRSVSPECESGPCCSAASWRSTPSQVRAPPWWRRCPYLRTRALLEAVQRYLNSTRTKAMRKIRRSFFTPISPRGATHTLAWLALADPELRLAPPTEPRRRDALRVVRRPADERRATCHAPGAPSRPGRSRLAIQAKPCGQGASRRRSCPGHRSRPLMVAPQDRGRRSLVGARLPKPWLRLARLSRQAEPGRSLRPDVGGSPRPGPRAARGTIVRCHGANR